jgi:hypothetical protein
MTQYDDRIHRNHFAPRSTVVGAKKSVCSRHLLLNKPKPMKSRSDTLTAIHSLPDSSVTVLRFLRR